MVRSLQIVSRAQIFRVPVGNWYPIIEGLLYNGKEFELPPSNKVKGFQCRKWHVSIYMTGIMKKIKWRRDRNKRQKIIWYQLINKKMEHTSQGSHFFSESVSRCYLLSTLEKTGNRGGKGKWEKSFGYMLQMPSSEDLQLEVEILIRENFRGYRHSLREIGEATRAES